MRRDIQRASNYVLGVVLFASSLFFAGMSTKLASRRLRVVMLSIGCAVFVFTAVWIATSPVGVSVSSTVLHGVRARVAVGLRARSREGRCPNLAERLKAVELDAGGLSSPQVDSNTDSPSRWRFCPSAH